MTNSKATLDDIQRADHILGGTAVEILKGKSTYSPANVTVPIKRVPIAPIILKSHPNEDLDIDFMYVQGAPYLLIKSVTIKFQAILAFNRISRKHKNKLKITYKRGPKDILRGVEKIISLFTNRGFHVETINADNEFQKLEGKTSAHVEICAAGQHVTRIERGVRTTKDRTRCYWVTLPFKKAPKLMVDECLTMVVTCLNDFPNKNGISTTLSPASIVLGRGKINGNNLKAIFRRYYEVYCGTDNTNKERRISAICLRPSNNQGGYYFMNVETGRKIHGYRFTELAMPDHIIDKVHALAEAEGAPDLDEDGCPTFEWELGTPIPTEIEVHQVEETPVNNAEDNDNAISTQSNEHDSDDVSYDGTYNPEDNDTDSDDDLISYDYDESDDDESISDQDNIDTTNDTTIQPKTGSENESSEEVRSEDQELRSDTISEHDSDSESEPTQKLRSKIDTGNIVNEQRRRTKTPRPNVESFSGMKYHANMLNIGEDAFSHFERIKVGLFSTCVGICFNQMTASKGIKLYGAKAVAAMFKEYKQLDDLEVLGRINPDLLTFEQKRTALRAVNLIKIKRCGKVKGRTCADGSTQRKYVPREEAASPTISLEALMSVLLINAYVTGIQQYSMYQVLTYTLMSQTKNSYC